MPITRFNLNGITQGPVDNSNLSPQRSSATDLQNQAQVTENDDRAVQAAQERQEAGDGAGARTAAEQVINPARRIQLFNELFGKTPAISAPNSLFKDGSTGVSDPLSLFFMMVFYLDSYTPQLSWSDVIKAAKASNGGTGFGLIRPDDTFLPQRFVFTSQPTVGQSQTNPIAQAQADNSRDVAAARAKSTQTVQQQRDANKTSVQTDTTGATTNKTGVSATAVWPIQNMPVVNGLSKDVDWKTSGNTSTIAEPITAVNGGGSNISLDLEFTYAVGLAGIGDGESTSTLKGAEPPPASDNNGNMWGVEDVMGMIYLATSLVYPFQSTKLLTSVTTQDQKDVAPQSQFPVVFLRHYSLFPFLTPFVVKSVKIEPDEGQPMIITDPQRLNNLDTHLSLPAVRQVVKITVSMQSAHYYLSLFGKGDDNGQLQIQTSGKTYLNLASGLLGGRI